MDNTVRNYFSEIGKRGGQRSRRTLDSETARNMTRLRDARRAYKRFYTLCFWSCDPQYIIVLEDVPWVAKQLMKHGGWAAWEAGAKLCR
jgi:hypothetical protein